MENEDGRKPMDEKRIHPLPVRKIIGDLSDRDAVLLAPALKGESQ